MTTISHDHVETLQGLKGSRSEDIKPGRFNTSSPKEVEEETANLMKNLKDMSKMFQRMTNNVVKK